MARSEIIGMKELERSIKQLGKVPQKCVTKAARSGASIALKSARANAPVDTGALKSGVIMKAERRVKVGKKVYDVMMDPAKNDLYVSNHKAGKFHSSVRRKKAQVGDTVRSYYPASMEYGFFTVNGRFIPGDHYLKRSLTENGRTIEERMVDVLSKEIDKEIGKG
jgi:hypothetical protein